MKTILSLNEKTFFIFAFFVFFSFSSVNAQLKVDSIGRVHVGVPHTLTNNDLDGVLSMQIFGKNTSTYSSGAKLAFGDYGRKSLNGCNVFIGEYGTTDTDKLWLHGKKGLYLTYGNSDPVIAYFDPVTSYDFNFNYNVKINGNLVLTSDERLKENIHPLQGSLGSLKRLRGVNYHLKNPARKNKPSHLRSDTALADEDVINLTEKERQDKEFFDNLEKELAEKSQLQNGFLAQELQQVFPDLVHEDKEGLLSVNYIGLIPIIVESIKEQQLIIDAQSKKIKELEQKNTNGGKSPNLRADTDESDSSGTTDMDDVNPTLSNAYLYQNAPNPFRVNTEIRYFLPEGIQEAYLCIFDMQGKMLKKLNAQAGMNTITVRGSELHAGMYLYSLIVDGQEVDTKRMILTK